MNDAFTWTSMRQTVIYDIETHTLQVDEVLMDHSLNIQTIGFLF